MSSLHVDDRVRLIQDIPELLLSRGELGVVRSTWCAPDIAYEVEFNSDDGLHNTRTLLLAGQVERTEYEEREVLGS